MQIFADLIVIYGFYLKKLGLIFFEELFLVHQYQGKPILWK
jgi:hypothetical protein